MEARFPSLHSSSGSLETLRSATKWSSFPSERKREKAGVRVLGDFFTVKRGIATGANSFFILDRREAIDLGIPETCFRPILPSSRHLDADVIEADDAGLPLLAKTMVLIDSDLAEEQIRLLHPRFWNYLERGKTLGIPEGYLASRRNPWYSQEKRNPRRFFAPTWDVRHNGKPFRFFWNQSQAVAANVYLSLYPKGPLKHALSLRPELFPVVHSILLGLRPDQLIDNGRVYGGGLHKLEPKELANLPADDLSNAIEAAASRSQMRLPF